MRAVADASLDGGTRDMHAFHARVGGRWWSPSITPHALERSAVRSRRDHWVMRTRSIQPGDIVYANKKGRLFHAKVLGAGDGGVLIGEPIARNISYRPAQSV